MRARGTRRRVGQEHRDELGCPPGGALHLPRPGLVGEGPRGLRGLRQGVHTLAPQRRGRPARGPSLAVRPLQGHLTGGVSGRVPRSLLPAEGGHRCDLVVPFPYEAAWGVPRSAVRNSFPWASNQRTRATSWAVFLTCPCETRASSIIERYFPRALLSGLAASKVGSASISASSKGLISW